MKTLSLLVISVLFSPVAMAQSQEQITIVSDPSTWYPHERSWDQDDIRWQAAPPPEAFIRHPDITTIPGPIPMHWNVTRLDPMTQARVLWTHEGWKVVTWGNNRVLPNLRDYRQPFSQLANGKSYYTRQDLPRDHAYFAEFNLIDRDHNGRISAQEHAQFQDRKYSQYSRKSRHHPGRNLHID